MRFFNIISTATGALFGAISSVTAKVTQSNDSEASVRSVTDIEPDTNDFDSALLRHEIIYSTVNPIEVCYDYSVLDKPVDDIEFYGPMDRDAVYINTVDASYDVLLCDKVILDYGTDDILRIRHLRGFTSVDLDAGYYSGGMSVSYDPDSLKVREYKGDNQVPGSVVTLFRAVTYTPMRITDAMRIIIDDTDSRLTEAPTVSARDLQAELANITDISFVTSSNESVTVVASQQVVLNIRRRLHCGKICLSCVGVDFIGDNSHSGYYLYQNSEGQKFNSVDNVLLSSSDYANDEYTSFSNLHTLGAGIYMSRANLSDCGACEPMADTTIIVNNDHVHTTHTTHNSTMHSYGVSYHANSYLIVALMLTTIAYNSVANVLISPIRHCINKMFGTVKHNDMHYPYDDHTDNERVKDLYDDTEAILL